MTLASFILAMVFGTVLAAGALGVLLVSITPTEAGMLGFALFYACLFLLLLGVTTLLGLGARLVFVREHHLVPDKVEMSFRQGIFLSLLTVAAFLLQSQSMLNWWNTALLIGGLSAVEMAFTALPRR